MGARKSIEARGVSLLLLPAYSPDLNPIEQVFANLKQLARTAEPRTRECLWQTIGTFPLRFIQAGCRNYLANAGYGQSA